ncbi:MAG: hypothetical protein A2538_03535 [Candidatus Magasanikbacteria bacterium RIFOXYD2_FULL_41_14]|uniref:Uncharacterized protein n=1 Tax=Candidatus Magasanikbacteria bacterium RIFOXYD2_FULL_41_14 TaxID=1798709 RepID=A0A1F6PD63_9BACT|nr:MAG: hypothetical protein A2538_03535 [Candidatus Magasanikbacteria bacterium RIFOXYD2_FULL_41_14]
MLSLFLIIFMANLQEIFNRIQSIKQKQKEIKSAYREALSGQSEYKEVVDKLNTLRARKKQIETLTRQEFSGEFTKLDDLKIDLASDMELLTDAALTKMMKGETVEVEDQYHNTYQPEWNVKFKKT